MSTNVDKDQATPSVSGNTITEETEASQLNRKIENEKAKKTIDKVVRKVRFPDNDDQLVTAYFEPANPWSEVPPTTREQLSAEYIECCRKHDTEPLDFVLQQIEELPEKCIGGGCRAPRFSLSQCTIMGARHIDAMEPLLSKVQFSKIVLQNAMLDDEAAEALFDMIEYYESANSLSMDGQRNFGLVGWHAASRLIARSSELWSVSVMGGALSAGAGAALARGIRGVTCRLTALCVQAAGLAGAPLLSLLLALKCNTSVRELRLGDNALSPEDALQLASALKYNHTLRLLDLSNNQIQDVGVTHLAKALIDQVLQISAMSPLSSPGGTSEPRGLAFLVLWNNQLTKNCITCLSKLLRQSRSLCVLNIGRNALGGEALRSLRGLGSLLCLGLQAARLGPDAGTHLAQLLSQTHLQRLDLRDNKLGSVGLQKILAAMKSNKTLTQMDLDDVSTEPAGSSSETALVARLTIDIRALCHRNERDAPPSPPASPHHPLHPLAHRKISLTCQDLAKSAQVPSRTRLRSPAPSPVPSPTPVPDHSRFSVTRVTPDKDSSAESNASSPSTPTRPTSRFRVVEVIETPKILIQPPLDSRKRKTATSRFSVTRNYDSLYNPSTSSTLSVDNKRNVENDTNVERDNNVENDPNVEKDTNVEPKQTVSDTAVNDLLQKSDSDSKKTDTDKDTVSLCDVSGETSVQSSISDDKVTSQDINVIIDQCNVDKCIKDDVACAIEILDVNNTSAKESVNKDVSPTKVTCEFKNIDDIIKREENTMKQIVAITEDLGNLIKEMQGISTKTKEITNKDPNETQSANVPEDNTSDIALKKIYSDTNLSKTEHETNRYNKNELTTSNSSSSLGKLANSMDLDTQMKCIDIPCRISAESSTESDATNLTTSITSDESESLVDTKKNSFSSLDASCSSTDTSKYIEKAMVTSIDSGIENSLKNTTENEGTLTLKGESQNTLTPSPKRTSSLLDVPTLVKTTERQRKISMCSPSYSFQGKPEPEKSENKLSSNLEKLLSLFHHPSSIFTRNAQDDEKKANTPPRKESTGIPSSFWSWGSNERNETTEKDESISEYTDSTLSERVQISYIDESFSKTLDSKSSSTDTDNTLSEFCSNAMASEISEVSEKMQEMLIADQVDRDTKDATTSCENLVQNVVLSSNAETSNNGNKLEAPCDIKDLIQPNDTNKNMYSDIINAQFSADNDQETLHKDDAKVVDVKIDDKPLEVARPRSFASVLKSSGTENTLDRQTSPDPGQSVDKLPIKVIRGIKENISPENTLTTTNISTLALELSGMHVQPDPTIIVSSLWETEALRPYEENKAENSLILSKDVSVDNAQESLADISLKKAIDEQNMSLDSGVTSLDSNTGDLHKETNLDKSDIIAFETIDLGRDALSYLIYESQDFDPDTETDLLVTKKEEGLVLSEELKNAEAVDKNTELSPELILDDVFTTETKSLRTTPIILGRTILKKANSLENLPCVDSTESEDNSPRIKPKIAFTIPETSGTTPKDIPKSKKLRSRSGSSPKSLPESFKQSPTSKIDHNICKKRKKVSSLGKIAKDSLLALNMTQEEIAEFRKSYKLTSVESLKSLESVSEDGTHSGYSVESRCRCHKISQESLMSLDSITEDCKCNEIDKGESSCGSAR